LQWLEIVKNRTPWRNAPLQEAVFEIRFPSISDYALFAGGMAMSQKQYFPTTQKLQVVDIPEIIELAGLVKHRFISQDQSLLFQTGSDVISINSINYKGLPIFLDNIEKILIAAESFVELSNFTKLGLRYINRFPGVENPAAVLNINLPFSDMDVSKTQVLQIQEVNKIDEEGALMSLNIQFIAAPKDLILDLDVSLNLPQESWDVAAILSWANKAHDIIWDKFQTLISESEKEVRI
jgi:uncharacterized protein (TIGR04255 family)